MGISGLILKKVNNYNFHETFENVLLSAKLAGLSADLFYKNIDEIKGTFTHATVSLTDKKSDDDFNGFCLYIFSSDGNADTDFDWVEPGLDSLISIEDFSGREKILLNFIFEYLQMNPQDYFWGEQEWVFDYKAIRTIKESVYDENWCYKNPNKLFSL